VTVGSSIDLVLPAAREDLATIFARPAARKNAMWVELLAKPIIQLSFAARRDAKKRDAYADAVIDFGPKASLGRNRYTRNMSAASDAVSLLPTYRHG
jgi:hypothetical protein